MQGVFTRRVAAKEVLDHDETRSQPCHPRPAGAVVHKPFLHGNVPVALLLTLLADPGALRHGVGRGELDGFPKNTTPQGIPGNVQGGCQGALEAASAAE